jgi:hypothetical protein
MQHIHKDTGSPSDRPGNIKVNCSSALQPLAMPRDPASCCIICLSVKCSGSRATGRTFMKSCSGKFAVTAARTPHDTEKRTPHTEALKLLPASKRHSHVLFAERSRQLNISDAKRISAALSPTVCRTMKQMRPYTVGNPPCLGSLHFKRYHRCAEHRHHNARTYTYKPVQNGCCRFSAALNWPSCL